MASVALTGRIHERTRPVTKVLLKSLASAGPSIHETLGLPWQVRAALGLHPGATPEARACSKTWFYGVFSKPFYYGGEGGTPGPICTHPPIS